MIIDGRTVPADQVIDVDVCIIGAGAAGIVCALEFEGSLKTVALIESGGRNFDPETQALYEGSANSHELAAARLRYFGGSTNCWMGRCRPLDVVDFTKRDWIANSGWPINLDEIRPYYRRAAEILNIAPLSQFYNESWPTRLYPGQYFSKFSNPQSRISGLPFVQVQDPPLRFGPTFEKQFERSKRVNVFLNSNLTRIQLTASATSVSHAKIKTLSGNNFSIQASNFILAMGGMENPRILLTSNDISPHGVGNNHDQVGRYFMGHPQTDMGRILYPNDENCFVKEAVSSPEGQLFFSLKPDVQRSQKILNSGFWLYREISAGEQAFREVRQQIISGAVPSDIGKKLLEMFGDISDVSQAFQCNMFGKRKRADSWRFWIQTEQVPDPNNRVALSDEKDRLGINKIIVKRSFSELDRQTATVSAKIFGAEVTRLGMGRVQFDELHKTYPLFTNEQDPTFGHDMGTTRMSDDPKTGVVDKNCQVFGVKNLFIAGSSVFSTSGFANPTMTIIALAARLASYVKSV